MQERSMFDHVTCNRSASVDKVTAPGALALDLIEQVRLNSKSFLVQLLSDTNPSTAFDFLFPNCSG